MASHLGRPKSATDKEFSLEPVAQKLSEHLGAEVLLLDEPEGVSRRKHLIMTLRKNQLILLENVRFCSR